METIDAAAPAADTDTDAATNGTAKYPAPLAPGEREAMLQHVITSWAISDIHVPREMAERALDEVLSQPLPDIG